LLFTMTGLLYSSRTELELSVNRVGENCGYYTAKILQFKLKM